jgi:hypothetical protein
MPRRRRSLRIWRVTGFGKRNSSLVRKAPLARQVTVKSLLMNKQHPLIRQQAEFVADRPHLAAPTGMPARVPPRFRY